MKATAVSITQFPTASWWIRWIAPIIVIAKLTVKESVRRLVFIAGLLIGLGIIALLAYVFANVKSHGEILSAEMQASLIIHSGLTMTRFFSAVMAIALACGAISTDLEKGTLTLILTKPLHRWQVVVGKWVGLVFVLTLNQILWLSAIEWGAWNRTGEWHWGVWKAGAIGFLYPMLFVSLNMVFSTRLHWLFSAIVSLVMMGIGWSETVMRNIGTLANLPRLLTLSKWAGVIMPTGRLTRWMIEQSQVMEIIPRLSGPPGVEMLKPAIGDLIYVFGYIVALLIVACLLFSRRDVG